MKPKNRRLAVENAKREIILDSARDAFSQNGFHLTRLEDIALGAGFSKASLYNYYTDKEEIFLSLAIREIGVVLESLHYLVDTTEGSPFLVREILHNVLEQFGKHQSFIHNMMNYQNVASSSSGICKHGSLMTALLSKSREISKVLGKMVAKVRKAGWIDSKLKDSELGVLLEAQFRGIISKWIMAGNVPSMKTAEENIYCFIKSGMQIRKRPRPQKKKR